MQRNRVLDTRVVSVEGDDVFYAHSSQLLQTKCAVERLSSRPLVLAALIQEWHNDIDSAGFSTDGCDDTLQILEVVVRRHVVGTETRNLRLDNVAVTLISFIGSDIFFRKFIAASLSPADQIIVDLFSKCGAAVQRDQSQSSDWQCVKMSFSSLTHALVPPKSFFWIRISFPKSLMMV